MTKFGNNDAKIISNPNERNGKKLCENCFSKWTEGTFCTRCGYFQKLLLRLFIFEDNGQVKVDFSKKVVFEIAAVLPEQRNFTR